MTRAEDLRPSGGASRAHRPATAVEDTLDLRLTEELLTLFAAGPESTGDARPPAGSSRSTGSTGSPARTGDTGDTAGRGDTAAIGIHDATPPLPGRTPSGGPGSSTLLDAPGTWRPATTPAGVFRLVPVRLERDLAVLTRWMNDPAVAAFWELAGPEEVTARHVAAQLDGDGRSVPCLGVLDGKAMSYWEIYRADLDPLARHYPARPHDTGVHLLIGPVTDRGRRVGTTLLRAVADLVLDHRPSCARVVAEPDLRNTPSVSAFLSAGFRFSAELELPGKKAALMIRDRAHRDHL
ncbi:GNAT family N-acetyltransferase [Streptomyces sp. NBC_00102]|uniref:GNAT family N-acetyltransferase n=1 Tax=Streptomyces sp. NBC_00102 TaxID=2975652 RepID=UPI00225A2F2B|nr:GNAT family N-acetyltransferase [Streptomyces sp. NBC_00102]MCX5400204.1 acetyltransferase [Streptomyces sp. NBC_00102]